MARTSLQHRRRRYCKSQATPLFMAKSEKGREVIVIATAYERSLAPGRDCVGGRITAMTFQEEDSYGGVRSAP